MKAYYYSVSLFFLLLVPCRSVTPRHDELAQLKRNLLAEIHAAPRGSKKVSQCCALVERHVARAITHHPSRWSELLTTCADRLACKDATEHQVVKDLAEAAQLQLDAWVPTLVRLLMAQEVTTTSTFRSSYQRITRELDHLAQFLKYAAQADRNPEKKDTRWLKKRYALLLLLALFGFSFSIILPWYNAGRLTDFEQKYEHGCKQTALEREHLDSKIKQQLEQQSKLAQQHQDFVAHTTQHYENIDVQLCQFAQEIDQRLRRQEQEMERVHENMSCNRSRINASYDELSERTYRNEYALDELRDDISGQFASRDEYYREQFERGEQHQNELYHELASELQDVRTDVVDTQRRLELMDGDHKSAVCSVARDVSLLDSVVQRQARDFSQRQARCESRIDTVRSDMVTALSSRQVVAATPSPPPGDGSSGGGIAGAVRGGCEILGAIGQWRRERADRQRKDSERAYEQEMLRRMQQLEQPKMPSPPLNTPRRARSNNA